MGSTLPRSRPLGQSLPLGEKSWSFSICMLCRRSFHCDGSLSLRLFALGLRANKGRLLGPCCLGGSPSRFIDQSRGVLLFVFYCSQRLSLISYFASYIIFFSYFLLLLLVEGFFFCCSAVGVTWRIVFSLVFSFLGVAYQNPRLIRPFPQCHLPKLKHISAEALP